MVFLKQWFPRVPQLWLLLVITGCGGGSSSTPLDPDRSLKIEQLGQDIYFDQRLSSESNTSCASCHNPEVGFVDPRPDESSNNQEIAAAVSLASDGFTLGDRNSPSNAYAKEIPDFSFVESRQRFNSRQPAYQGYLGGQFWDGRVVDLQEQAGSPLISHLEMQLESVANVADIIRGNSNYNERFSELYGDSVLDSDQRIFDELTEAVATFQRGTAFASFDSKYDKFLNNEFEYRPGSKAALGKAFFFSQQFTNCSTCHQLRPVSSRNETFSSYEFHNIGVPKNNEIRARNGRGENFIDEGLALSPLIADADREQSRGKFKSPTLRNIAVTAPYMHNGVFKDLTTVIHFYMHRRAGPDRESQRPINPETGVEWDEAEITENIAWSELADGRNLNDQHIEGLVCFMHTLTDERYESLLPDLDCF